METDVIYYNLLKAKKLKNIMRKLLFKNLKDILEIIRLYFHAITVSTLNQKQWGYP